jgi:hypothetical protein
MKNDDLDIIKLFKGLTPDQARLLSARIGVLLPVLRDEIINPPQSGNKSDGSNEPEEIENMELTPEQVQAIQEEIDRQVAAQVGRVNNEIRQEGEASRLAELDQQEREELAGLPRGSAGLVKRSNVNAKYQALRYGEKTNGSVNWLEAEREKKKLQVPETNDQYELMQAYQQAIRGWVGNVRRISTIQAAFRARGLKI